MCPAAHIPAETLLFQQLSFSALRAEYVFAGNFYIWETQFPMTQKNRRTSFQDSPVSTQSC